MVEHEPHVAHRAGDGERGRQLTGLDEQVVGQAGRADGAQAAAHVGPAQPVRVRLVLDQVPDPGQ